MRSLPLYGSNVTVRDHYCTLDDNEPREITEQTINVYVQMTTDCNAACKFCVYHAPEKRTFDVDKLESVLSTITKTVGIHKISFTGGEPTMNVDLLGECLRRTKNVTPQSFTVVNTNGHNVDRLLNTPAIKLINSLAISRHHYDDATNDAIFGATMLPKTRIAEIQAATDIVHLSCNLQNDFIHTFDDVIAYLEHAADMNVCDVGFVSLMNVNVYAAQQSIDFDDIAIDADILFNNLSWHDSDRCKCKNYLYISKKDPNTIVRAYARRVLDRKNMPSTLVYDGNHLRAGFGGEVLA